MGRRDWGSGSVERRGKGRWRLSYELGGDPDTGKRHRRRWAFRGTKREAIQALLKAMSEHENGGVNPDEITTAEWLTQWLDGRVSDRKIGSAAEYNYRGIIKNHLTREIGSVRLQDLNAAHIRTLKSKLLASRKPRTVKKTLGLLRQALQSAVQQELLAANPASAVPMPSPDQEDKDRRALEEDEITKLREAAEGTPYDMVVRFALATGARQGEVLGATWKEIDLERGTFHVIYALKEKDGEPYLGAPKTRRSRRMIALSPAFVELLRNHRKEQDAARRELGEEWENHDLVFPIEGGGYWRRSRFYKGYRRLVNGSGIKEPKDVNFHTLRHTAASQWTKADVDTLTISRRLGHASAAFTLDNYAHELIGQQDDAARVFDDLIT